MTVRFDVVGSGQSWQARKNGQPFGRSYRNPEQAEQLITRVQREEQLQKRDCMTCQNAFISEGSHNRMCGKCRREFVWRF